MASRERLAQSHGLCIASCSQAVEGVEAAHDDGWDDQPSEEPHPPPHPDDPATTIARHDQAPRIAHSDGDDDQVGKRDDPSKCGEPGGHLEVLAQRRLPRIGAVKPRDPHQHHAKTGDVVDQHIQQIRADAKIIVVDEKGPGRRADQIIVVDGDTRCPEHTHGK